MYDLESMLAKFIEHGKIANQNHIEWIETFAKNNPGEPLPDHLSDPLNLPLVLASICSELLALKEKSGVK